MGKNKNKYRGVNNTPQTTQPVSAPTTFEGLEARAAESGVKIPDTPEVSDALDRLKVLIAAYESAKHETGKREVEALEMQEYVEGEQRKLVDDLQALQIQKRQLEEGRRTLEGDKAQLDEARRELVSDREALSIREQSVLAREADAAVGFIKLRGEALQKAHDELGRYSDRVQSLFDIATNKNLEAVEKIEAARERLFSELSKQLQTGGEHLKKQQELEKQLREAHWAKQAANEKEEQLEEYIARRAEEATNAVQRKLERLQVEVNDLEQECKDLQDQLRERDKAARDMGHLSPERVQNERAELRSRIQDLQNELDRRPGAEEAVELDHLRREEASWQQQRVQLLQENGRLQSQLNKKLVEVDEHESLRDVNKVLHANQELLRSTITDLEEQYSKKLDTKGAFPQLLEFDTDPKLKSAQNRLHDQVNLREFCQDLQNRLAQGVPNEIGPLYYRIEDLRAFVAGLAMSRLHLIHGISGIGKSSLPRAFAQAVGGFCDTVSVQAGWRDRNDLLGYYNSFERKYYESDFVQALYKAQMPQRANRIALVLLDEMNLSHPEQYAADLLDVLERTEASGRRFSLVHTRPAGALPQHLVDGRFLPLPRNVWFIGTANHDETTRDFAPKTYDRSFVLELPPRHAEFRPSVVQERAPVGLNALQKAFDNAIASKRSCAREALDWLHKNLRALLASRFEIGWGARLESQAASFVPVVVESGGSTWEALDQLASSRLLRSVRRRHDNQAEDLKQLLDVFESTWPDRKVAPARCNEIITEELRRLGASV